MTPTWQILQGDARLRLRTLAEQSVQCVVTSPPYWRLRDYGVDGQIGMEDAPSAYVQQLVVTFREIARVLRRDGVCWLNLADTYFGDSPTRSSSAEAFSEEWDPSQTRSRGGTRRSAASIEGLKTKDLCGIPWRVALALQDDGWYLRADIIWSKPNPMPESVTDRTTKSHEYIFLLSQSAQYFYDAHAIYEPYTEGTLREAVGGIAGIRKRQYGRPGIDINGGNQQKGFIPCNVNAGGRNARSVWTIHAQSFDGAHFATFPETLAERCIKAGSRLSDLVLDPFCGSGTTGAVAITLGRSFVGIELKPEYAEMARQRVGLAAPLFASEAEPTEPKQISMLDERLP